MNKKNLSNKSDKLVDQVDGGSVINKANPSSFIMKSTLTACRLRLPTIYSGRCPQHTSTAEV